MPSQRILQQACELGVAVRYVLVLVCQADDYVAQRRERLVDVLRLLQAVASGAAHREALGASEVDEVDTGGALLAGLGVAPADGQTEDGVRARGARVAVGRGRAALGTHTV